MREKLDFVDYLIKGEGEYKFANLIKSLKNDTELCVEDNDIVKFEKLPWPSRDSKFIGKSSIIGRTMVDRFYRDNSRVCTVQTDRGCPFKCTYCSGHLITKRRYRSRTIEDIIAEVTYLRDSRGIEVFVFNSEVAGVNKKYTKNFYKKLIPLKVRWVHNGGFYVDLMDEEMIRLAIESGLIVFNLAIESGSKNVLKLVKKSERIVDCAENIVNIIRKYSRDIYVTCFFLSGFPFEKMSDFDKSKRLIMKLDIDWIFWNIYQPFEGCELYDHIVKENLLYSRDHSGEMHYTKSVLKNPNLDMEELSEKIYQFQLMFNFEALLRLNE